MSKPNFSFQNLLWILLNKLFYLFQWFHINCWPILLIEFFSRLTFIRNLHFAFTRYDCYINVIFAQCVFLYKHSLIWIWMRIQMDRESSYQNWYIQMKYNIWNEFQMKNTKRNIWRNGIRIYRHCRQQLKRLARTRYWMLFFLSFALCANVKN